MSNSSNSAAIAQNCVLAEVAAMENHYAYAHKLACEIVEKMARQILSEQKQLGEFVMAMGTYFFTYKSKKRKGETLDPYVTLMNSSFNYYLTETEPFFKPLSDFISEWDPVLKITGEPMRFTAKGEKVTDW